MSGVIISGATDSCEITVITHPLIVTSSAQNGGKYLFLTQTKKKYSCKGMFSNRHWPKLFGNVIAIWPYVLVGMQAI